MSHKKHALKRRKSSKRPLILSAIPALLVLILAATVAYFRSDMRKEEKFLPYEGRYQFQEVFGPVGSKVGDQVVLSYHDDRLVAKVSNGPREIFLYPETGDDFNVKQFGYHVIFLRDASGKVTGLYSRTNKSNFYFMLQKMDL